jgi:hypothetical protein
MLSLKSVDDSRHPEAVQAAERSAP